MAKSQMKNNQQSLLMKYLYYSIIVTILDAVIVWTLFRVLEMELVTANTIGVIAGFLVHYRLSSKSIFHTEFGLAGFGIYFGTFIFGLLFADGLIFIGQYYIFESFQADYSFFLSKGLSIGIPFIFQYLIRRTLFHNLMKKRILKKENSKENYHFS